MSANEFIGGLRHLGGRADADRGLALLKRVAAHVRPIMKSKGFRVGTLEEFYPSQSSLLGLNVNRGQTIRLRLRSAGNDRQFLNFEDIVGTMLHELTHNIHGPHDATFYRYLDDLISEYEGLITSGSFQPDGKMLGGRSISPQDARLAAIQAIEKRKRLNQLTQGSGQRLGGGKNLDRSLTPAQLAAAAAERRRYDNICCGGGYGDGGKNAAVDLKAEESQDRVDVQHAASSTKAASASAASGSTVSGKSLKRILPASASPADQIMPASKALRTSDVISLNSDEESDAEWVCRVCTLINRPLALQCDCCLSIRHTI
eukprot:jgi/Hompol1/2312/HPOL_001971-RA